MKHKITAFLLALGVSLSATAASALDVDGQWLRTKTGAHITSFSCKGGLGLKMNSTGKVHMCGAKPVGGGKYEGQLVSPDDGRTYTGVVEITGNTLKLSGCVLGGLICRSETLSKLN